MSSTGSPPASPPLPPLTTLYSHPTSTPPPFPLRLGKAQGLPFNTQFSSFDFLYYFIFVLKCNILHP